MAGQYRVHFEFVEIHADDAVAKLRQASGADAAHIAETNHHYVLFNVWRWGHLSSQNHSMHRGRAFVLTDQTVRIHYIFGG